MGPLVSFIVFTLCISFLLSWFIYVPLFMRLLRRSSEEEFMGMGSHYFFFGKIIASAYLYFLLKHYRRSADADVRFHGEILTVTFAYAPIIVILMYYLRGLYE
ncbi:hypothetical protein GCM10011487_22180 [Steroidobacter agaridevorans]|uniref:Uncharacterized protein n=2 Tax=Steroidobacter agaridevorans TaxID=2695856 RepID=A0A829YBL7_9GAMM|nr:hypothetical protein [Steroidobacter agaridevorans]GFE80218.1 hypothetical protein GCM10011487_22180 [Steroidobacter agaridevorans]